MTVWNRHPGVRSGDELTFGERAADVAVKAMGSWPFLIVQALFIAVWMVLNVVAWCGHWDPAPWILLNLMFSIQAAFAAPLILLAGVRADAKRAEVAIHTMESVDAIAAKLAEQDVTLARIFDHVVQCEVLAAKDVRDS